MPPPDGRAGSSLYVYVVSCVLLLAVVAGGTFLVLYIALPASDDTAWFPVAGMLLVGAPWLFWTATYMYRVVSINVAAYRSGIDQQAVAGRAPAAAAGGEQEAAGVETPGRGRRVRFGATTVLGSSVEERDSSSEQPAEVLGGEAAEEGSSHASHESELPLFATT